MTDTDVFGKDYAELYDLVYSDKDYDGECDVIEAVVARHGGATASRVLDLGCGTGEHSIRLAARGFSVTGVDNSAPMIERAKQKSTNGGLDVTWEIQDVRRLDLDARSDLALMMFAVLGYMTTDDDALLALSAARRHLTDQGILIFDVWYGPAVLNVGPEPRSRVIRGNWVTLRRRSLATINASGNTCDVEIWMRAEREGGEPVEAIETHRMRFYFQEDLEHILARAGFELISLSAFPDLDSPVSDMTWNVLGVARCVEAT